MRAARRDTNEPDIVAALRDMGYVVGYLYSLADLAVRRSHWPEGQYVLLELKGEDGDLTERQISDRAAGHSIPVVRTVAEAIEVLDAAGG